jgi:uncharacterized surface protein with fasciclin (FAS1) repeats
MRTFTTRRLAWIAAPAVALLFTASCSDDDTDAATTTTDPVAEITDDLEVAGEGAQAELEAALRSAGLTNLASAVAQVDLSELLDGNEFTVFAPNDEAFLALDSDDLSALLADPTKIADLLQNHIVVGEQLSADDLEDAGSVTTEAGTSLTVTGSGASLSIEGANVTSTQTAGDGTIHVIDAVLLDGAVT